MKILVIDDHVLIRESLRSVFKELKPEAAVVEATNSREAMQLVEDHPDLALVLLDLSLPDSDGFQVLAELRERYPTIPVVVLSGHHDRANVVRVLEFGALGFIPKTAQRPVLVSALSLVFSGGDLHSARNSSSSGASSVRTIRTNALCWQHGASITPGPRID